MLYKEFPILLDKILMCFVKDISKEYDVETIKNFIYEEEHLTNLKKVKTATNESLDLMVKNIFTDLQYVEFGLEFLQNEGLVKYNSDKKLVSITPKGYAKVKTHSFSKEIRTTIVNLWLQRATWFCSICALFISVYSLWSRNTSFASQSPCCQIHFVHESNQVQNDTIVPLEKKAKSIQK